ncbi:hypothetical protein LZ30DRAFT_738841 [Colletotrichum cereale]|nr:hypothetical protein LZ30DRAFT_738841 [Colletotrichum cereale]
MVVLMVLLTLSAKDGPVVCLRRSFSASFSAFLAALISAGPGSNAGRGPRCGGQPPDASLPAVKGRPDIAAYFFSCGVRFPTICWFAFECCGGVSYLILFFIF